MGKFVKKGKITGDMAVMNVPQSPLGVRTRAKTLALQHPEFFYLQLRNRRLEKARFSPPSPTRKPEKKRHGSKLSNRSRSRRSPGSRLRVESVNPVAAGPGSFGRSKIGEVEKELNTEKVDGLAVEENKLELDATGRNTPETAPRSLIRNMGSIGTPVSTMRSTQSHSDSANQRSLHDHEQRSTPLTREIDDFFANAGRQQQQQFMDKYNFDIMNDVPMSGRFEWVRVDP